MVQSLSEDLRVRIIRADAGGIARNAVARRFGVSLASAVRWMHEYLHTGRTEPKPWGGDRRSGRIATHAGFPMTAIVERPDKTLAALRGRLVDARGKTFAISAIHNVFRRHAICYA